MSHVEHLCARIAALERSLADARIDLDHARARHSELLVENAALRMRRGPMAEDMHRADVAERAEREVCW